MSSFVKDFVLFLEVLRPMLFNGYPDSPVASRDDSAAKGVSNDKVQTSMMVLQ